MIRRLLIANRGEIAGRIARAARKLGIEPLFVYMEGETGLDYLEGDVKKYRMKGHSIQETYLNSDQLIRIALEQQADAIHPGYGFLSENVAFAKQCIENNLIWVGPSAEAMTQLSDKSASRARAISLGVPVLKALTGTPEEIISQAVTLDGPLLVKAAGGGGGRGMRIIHTPEELAAQVEAASREAELFFGDPRVYVEQYIQEAKHIEVQVIGDKHGNLVHLAERECTIQRRYQKLIEESPSPSLSESQRAAILSDAVTIARSARYDSAGTLEFLLDNNGSHYFLEMNTRIQVEHPVTEMVTGIDLIALQIQIADGTALPFRQEDIQPSGHAIECRICAEDPASGFDPRPGLVIRFQPPEGDGIRTDTAVGEGFSVSPRFDSLIAKIIVQEENRDRALKKMDAALSRLVVHGVVTTGEFLREVIRQEEFRSGNFHTGFIKEHGEKINERLNKKKREHLQEAIQAARAAGYPLPGHSGESKKHRSPWNTVGYWRSLREMKLEWNGTSMDIAPLVADAEPNSALVCSIHPDRSVWVTGYGLTWRVNHPARERMLGARAQVQEAGKPAAGEAREKNSGRAVKGSQAVNGSGIYAPLPGIITRLLVSEGDVIAPGTVVAVLESMKTENSIRALSGGRIGTIHKRAGGQVKLNELILEVEQI